MQLLCGMYLSGTVSSICSHHSNSSIGEDPIMRKHIVCALLTVLSVLPTWSLQAQWAQTSPLGGGPIQCLASSGSNLFAGTMNGGVFRSTDNGASWVAVNTGLTNHWVTSLVFIGNNLFAGTNNGVFLSTNNGGNWNGVNSGLWAGNVWALAVSGTNLFAGTGIAGGVFRSTDYGASWTALTSGPTSLFVGALAVSGSNLFAGTKSGIYVSSDNGTSWRAANAGLTNTNVHAFAVSGSSVFAGTDYGIFRTTDGGSLWTAADTGLVMPAPVTVFAVNGSNVFAGMHSTLGGSMGCFLSTDNGATWVNHSAGLSAEEQGGFAMAVCGGYLFCGGQPGNVWKRPLSELTNYWVPQRSPLGTTILGDIQFVSSTEGWIVAGNGKLLHTINSGTNWSIVSPAGTDTVSFNVDNLTALSPLSFVNATTGWVIGTLASSGASQGAALYKTTNGGTTWSRQLLSGWSAGFGIQFVDSNHGWAEVVNGSQTNFTFSIVQTTDGGNRWTAVYSSNTTFCIPSFVDANNGWGALGTMATGRSSVSQTTDGGWTWHEQLSDSATGSFRAIQFLDVSNGWVVGDSGKIFRTTNGGATWTRMTNSGNNSEHRILFFLDANVGWIGSRVFGDQGEGILLHTADGGKSWTIQDVGSQADITGIYYFGADNGWVTGYNGALARSTGTGITSVRLETPGTVSHHLDLEQNYPNPFNPSTTIRYEIPQAAQVTLKVYNILGVEVETLVSEFQGAGFYQVRWDAKLPSGVYFYRLQSGLFTETKKLLLLR
jgi:photosystem II stability/assembly factor-like uncharacterized protein